MKPLISGKVLREPQTPDRPTGFRWTLAYAGRIFEGFDEHSAEGAWAALNVVYASIQLHEATATGAVPAVEADGGSTGSLENFVPRPRRSDGWPMCPGCGEDELWAPDSVRLHGKPLEEWFAVELHCYRCQTVVPPGFFKVEAAT